MENLTVRSNHSWVPQIITAVIAVSMLAACGGRLSLSGYIKMDTTKTANFFFGIFKRKRLQQF